MSLVCIASDFVRFVGEIPWEMLRALVQEHSLRKLQLGYNKFTVDTIPEVVGTMTKLKVLDLRFGIWSLVLGSLVWLHFEGFLSICSRSLSAIRKG
jgi:hypothetical protein